MRSAGSDLLITRERAKNGSGVTALRNGEKPGSCHLMELLLDFQLINELINSLIHFLGWGAKRNNVFPGLY